MKCLLTSLLFSISSIFYAQDNLSEVKYANKYLEERGEVYIRIEKVKSISVNNLSKLVSIDKTDEFNIYFYANDKEFSEFLKLNIDFEVLTPPSLIPFQSNNNFKSLYDDIFSKYPSYEEYLAMMDSFSTTYPSICSLAEIGETVEGRKLIFVKISDNVNIKEAEPEFMYGSSMHGDELVGFMLMLKLIDYLLSNYAINAEIENLIDNVEIWINPLANPDGTYHTGNSTVSGATRYNANSVDLNRNFPDPEDGPNPDGNDYQPEVVAMMNFMEQHNFVLSANLHGGSEVVNYPWDTWEERHIDDDWFQFISHEYADTARLYSNQTYLQGFNDGIVNGYDWYSISGGRQDYVTYFLHGREVTIELSNTKLPDISEMEKFWNYNYRSLINYINQCTYGISGLITDSITGFPVKAKVIIQDHDNDMSYIWSDSLNGNYHRLVLQDTYNLTFQAYGYKSKSINSIRVNQNEVTRLDIQLQPNYKLDTLNKFSYIKDTLYTQQILSDTIIVDSLISDTTINTRSENDTIFNDTVITINHFIDTIITEIIYYDTVFIDITIVHQTITQTSIYDTLLYSTKIDTSTINWVKIDTLMNDTIITDTIIYYITRLGQSIYNPVIIDTSKTSIKDIIFFSQYINISQNENYLNIDFKDCNMDKISVNVYSIQGISIFREDYVLNANCIIQINKNHFRLNKGINILHLQNNDIFFSEKILIW